VSPDKDVTPEEAMILAGSIYGGCMVNVSLDIYVQKDMQGIRASVSAVQCEQVGSLKRGFAVQNHC
jgi:hypothetical protein